MKIKQLKSILYLLYHLYHQGVSFSCREILAPFLYLFVLFNYGTQLKISAMLGRY